MIETCCLVIFFGGKNQSGTHYDENNNRMMGSSSMVENARLAGLCAIERFFLAFVSCKIPSIVDNILSAFRQDSTNESPSMDG